MSLDRPPRLLPADTAGTQLADAFIWVHPAFCSMALPMRTTRSVWQRNIDAGSIRIEPSVSGDVVPSGRILRLSMMHICDVAFRANSQIVELGENEALLAVALGIDAKTRDLGDQWHCLQAARIMVSADGGAEVSVFDARGRRRAGDVGWRSGVRLSTKFLSSLVEHAVPLDRSVVRELSATPMALDAYAPRFEVERLTVLAVEPLVLQVSGGLNEKDFERVSAWVMSNRDIIDEFWEGRITSFAELNQRVRKVPGMGWR